MSALLKRGERLDELDTHGHRIIQNPSHFCFGMDAVLLAAFTDIRPRERHLDIGCAGGIIPILLAIKHPQGFFSGIEIQATQADMAWRSASLNGLTDRVRIIHGDIRRAVHPLCIGSVDVITANPPYMPKGAGLENTATALAIARHEIMCTLECVISAAARLLRFGGRFYMVHRPARLADIICELRAHKLEPKALRFVQPTADAAPNMLLIMAAKGGGPQLVTKPPLIVYDAGGEYTKEVRQVYYAHTP